MKQSREMELTHTQEEFSWGATITVLLLLLTFVGASFYVLISSFMDI